MILSPKRLKLVESIPGWEYVTAHIVARGGDEDAWNELRDDLNRAGKKRKRFCAVKIINGGTYFKEFTSLKSAVKWSTACPEGWVLASAEIRDWNSNATVWTLAKA